MTMRLDEWHEGAIVKPTLKLNSIMVLSQIDEYIQQFDVKGDSIVYAASDVCDGLFDRQELDELIRKQILFVCKYDEYPKYLSGDSEWLKLCGSSWTVGFTEAAVKHFWPAREHELTIKRPVSRRRISKRPTLMRHVRGSRPRCSSHNGKKAVPKRWVLPR